MAEGVPETTAASSIVEDWLRSVDLVQYTQAFLDNGYDDLEVCKQIGEDDVKAIGVLKDDHKERLLRAVKVLKEEGGTAVYFTLEECDTCQSGDETEVGESADDDRSVIHSSRAPSSVAISSGGGGGGRHHFPSHPQPGMSTMHGYNSRRKPLTTFSSVQLKLILRDKLTLDNIDLSNPPYTNMDQCMCGSSVTALALRFSQELNTHFAHVLEQLEDLWIMANNEAANYPDMCRSPSRGMYTRSQSVPYDPHLHGGYRGYALQPPPLPTCPPPATMSSSHVGRCTSLQAHLDKGHMRPDPISQPNYVAIDGGVCCLFPRKIITDPSAGAEEKKKGGSVFGRFLRNFGLRRSARKAAYKQHHGDLNAYDMSMSEEDRMALMLLVKEGKISTQTALAVVQKYEEEKRLTGGLGGGNSAGIGALALEVSGKENVHETPSKKLGLVKKKKGKQPPKSQSSLSADDPHHGGLHSPISEISSPTNAQGTCDHLVCRRVHSLGQLDGSHQPSPLELHHDTNRDKMVLTRAVSCSPACTPNHKLIGHGDANVLSRLQSPSHHHPSFPLVHLHSHAQPNLFQHSYQPHPLQHQQHQHHNPQQQQQHLMHSQQQMKKIESLRERLSVRATTNMPKTSSKTSLLSSGSDQSMDCLSHPPLRSDPLNRRGCNDGNTYNSNSTVSMSSENSPALGRKKNGTVPDSKLKNHRSASCSTGDDGISSENDDPEQRSRSRLKADAVKGKANHERRQHGHRVKEAHIYRPPLLRQQSAPMSGLTSPERYLGQAKAVVDFTPGSDQEGFVPLKKGEIVNILNMAQSGVWRGVVNGKQGKFRFEHVEVIIDPDAQTPSPISPHSGGSGGVKELMHGHKDMPQNVADMLTKIGLESLTNLFMTNGYDDLDIFSELDENDLDTLHVTDANQRTRLLSAAKVLADWNEKLRSHTPSITAVDSPSSRAGNSSCDSGCYAGGEGGTKHKYKDEGKKGDRTKAGHHAPCTSCGKPKQALKASSSTPVAPLPPPPPLHASYPTTPTAYPQGPSSAYVPYTPGHHGIPYMTNSSHYNSAGYPPIQDEVYHGSMTNSRTLTEFNVAESAMTPSHSSMMVYPGGSSMYRDRYFTGDSQSLTEEDQEVIAITYGTHRRRKLSTPAQVVSTSSSHSEIAGSLSGTYTPSYGYYRQYDGVSLCSDPTCPQCVAYMSCPQCATYHHYVNTTIRSDSKSSKMSYSSNCTQTTCLSPDQDENNSSCHSDLPTSPNRLTVYPHHGYPPQSPHQNVYPLSPSYGQMALAVTPNKFISTHVSPEVGAHNFSNPPPVPGENPKQQPIKGSNSPAQSYLLAGGGDQTPQLSGAATPKNEGDANTVHAGIWPQHSSDDSESHSIASLYSRDGDGRSPSKLDSASGVMNSPMRSLLPLVSTKLSAERIDLGTSPYSTETGECCIPPLLVQRYAEELRQDLQTVSLVLEQIRAKQLQERNKPYLQTANLSDACASVELQISSVPAFLTSIGLPMYEEVLTEAKVTTLEQLMTFKGAELEKVTGADSRHLQRITHALEWVQSKLSSPTQRGKTTGPIDKV